MWIFSGLLVQVGVAQAWLVYRTWGQIERQAGIMPGQLKTMGDQVAEMRRGFDPRRHQMSWDTAWRNLRKTAGFDKIRFHDLRDTPSSP
jgi:hypothetical protein